MNMSNLLGLQFSVTCDHVQQELVEPSAAQLRIQTLVGKRNDLEHVFARQVMEFKLSKNDTKPILIGLSVLEPTFTTFKTMLHTLKTLLLQLYPNAVAVE